MEDVASLDWGLCVAESVADECCQLAPESQVCAAKQQAETECLSCDTRSRPVSAAHVMRQVLRPMDHHIEGDYGFCSSPTCQLVFAGPQGAVLTARELRHPPAYKTGRARDLLCYCFDFRGSDFLSPEGDAAVAYISERIRAGDCACDITNPSAGCCLGSIAKYRQEHKS